MKFLLVLLAVAILAHAQIQEVNIALKKPTKQSFTYQPYNEKLAVDGDLNTQSMIPPNTDGLCWWQVDLGDTYYISDITVVNTKLIGHDLDIQGIFTILSLDNKISYDVLSMWSFNNKTIAAGESVTMKKDSASSASDAARYITIWKYKIPYKWLTLTEVIVHGAKDAPKSSVDKYNCENKSPCTAANIDANIFYFAHETNGFYVQCSQHGSCYKMPCAGGLIWNVEKNGCTVGGL